MRSIYRCYCELQFWYAEAQGPSAEVTAAVLMGAYCVLFEVYDEAWDQKLLRSEDLPSEITEGGPELWAEFAESLTHVRELLGEGADRGIANIVSTWNGDPSDRLARRSRAEIEGALGLS